MVVRRTTCSTCCFREVDHQFYTKADEEANQIDLTSNQLYQKLNNEQKELLAEVSAGNNAKLDLAARATADPNLGMQLWKLLETIDPIMAGRWHYRDSRKVANSLRVFKETGVPHSEWIAKQDQQSSSSNPPQKKEVKEGVSGYRKLLFWLWCDPPIHRQRLDDRVDEMVQRGLEQEVREMRDIARSMLNDTLSPEGEKQSYQSGIFQTIGYRQFAEYLDRLEALTSSSPSQAEKEKKECFDKAVADTKTATRQYANRNSNGSKTSSFRGTKSTSDFGKGEEVELYLLDTSDVSNWNQNVLIPP